jgi:hypothetical protein
MFWSRRTDGHYVLDVNGPVLGAAELPSFGICTRCWQPHYAGAMFRVEDVPLRDGYLRGALCPRGHLLIEPDYFNFMDNSPRHEPRILHVRRPKGQELSGAGWLTRQQADSLLDAARAVIEGRDQSGAFAKALAEAPEPIKRLRKPNMTRDQWIALASLVVAVVSAAFTGVTVAQGAEDKVSSDHLVSIIERLVDESHPDHSQHGHPEDRPADEPRPDSPIEAPFDPTP